MAQKGEGIAAASTAQCPSTRQTLAPRADPSVPALRAARQDPGECPQVLAETPRERPGRPGSPAELAATCPPPATTRDFSTSARSSLAGIQTSRPRSGRVRRRLKRRPLPADDHPSGDTDPSEISRRCPPFRGWASSLPTVPLTARPIALLNLAELRHHDRRRLRRPALLLGLSLRRIPLPSSHRLRHAHTRPLRPPPSAHQIDRPSRLTICSTDNLPGS